MVERNVRPCRPPNRVEESIRAAIPQDPYSLKARDALPLCEGWPTRLGLAQSAWPMCLGSACFCSRPTWPPLVPTTEVSCFAPVHSPTSDVISQFILSRPRVPNMPLSDKSIGAETTMTHKGPGTRFQGNTYTLLFGTLESSVSGIRSGSLLMTGQEL